MSAKKGLRKLFIRSPYIITIDKAGQINAKIEVFLWNKGSSEPTTPNYTVTKPVPSAEKRPLSFNVSNFAKEFIKPISAEVITSPTITNASNWCYMRVKEYSNNNLERNTLFICLNGYTSYMGGVNQINNDLIVPLFDPSIPLQYNQSANVSVFIDEDFWQFPVVNGQNTLDTNSTAIVSQFQSNVIKDGGTFEAFDCCVNTISGLGVQEDITFQAEQVCEPKYDPVVCTFVNQFGGWQYLTFFKAKKENIQVERKDYNLMQANVNYNPLIGQKKQFNQQGKRNITLNTGYVSESYFSLIQDLMLSNKILLDNTPVIIKSSQSDVKTSLNEKLINYEIEFEYAFGLINDVI